MPLDIKKELEKQNILLSYEEDIMTGMELRNILNKVENFDFMETSIKVEHDNHEYEVYDVQLIKSFLDGDRILLKYEA